MNSIPDREKRRQSLQCRLYGLPRAYPRMQGEGMLERTRMKDDPFMKVWDLCKSANTKGYQYYKDLLGEPVSVDVDKYNRKTLVLTSTGSKFTY